MALTCRQSELQVGTLPFSRLLRGPRVLPADRGLASAQTFTSVWLRDPVLAALQGQRLLCRQRQDRVSGGTTRGPPSELLRVGACARAGLVPWTPCAAACGRVRARASGCTCVSAPGGRCRRISARVCVCLRMSACVCMCALCLRVCAVSPSGVSRRFPRVCPGHSRFSHSGLACHPRLPFPVGRGQRSDLG